MEALPLRVVPSSLDLLKQQMSEPLKVQLKGNVLVESDEEETENCVTTGTATPDSHTSSGTMEPASPAFVAKDELEASVVYPVATVDSSAPAFVSQDELEATVISDVTPAKDSLPAFVPQDTFGSRFDKGLWPTGTTASIYNIPQWYTQELLLEEIEDSGFRFERDFDYFFLPHDFSSGLNFGCCFVNFASDTAWHAFEAAFHERKPRLAEREAAFEVRPTTIQDLEKIDMHQVAACLSHETESWAEGYHAKRAAPRFCPNCGSAADADRFNFCSQCGASLAHLRRG
mmetsp:Transcript_19046/g.44778  ORF Transcript_19046/g.44778 Transcript_19046/m.44778 type:complete len:287 (-) Transcript_19046:370-1230(-)